MQKIQTEDDIGQLLWLDTQNTGIPFSIGLSDIGCSMGAGIFVYDSYEPNFQGDYQNIKEVDPSSLDATDLSVIAEDFQVFKLWISKNLENLKAILNGLFDEVDFVQNMLTVSKSEANIDRDVLQILNENLASLNEMANLFPRKTGLPAIIYISMRQASHEARIKIFDSKSKEKIGNNQGCWISMLVSDNPTLDPHAGKPKYLKPAEIEVIRQWVIQHKQTLLDLWNGDILITDAINQLILH